MNLEKIAIPASILVGSLIIGAFIYFSNLSKGAPQTSVLPTKTPTESPIVTPIKSPTPTTTLTPTVDDLSLIKQALAIKLGKKEEDLIISLSQQTEKHAKGSVREKTSEVGGGYYLAAKTEGKWIIVYDGQSTPACLQIAPYNFPKEMVSECLSEAGALIKR